MAKNDFGKTWQKILHTPCGPKNLVQLTRTISEIMSFVFYAGIQDGHQKSWENNFSQKMTDDCT